MDAPAQDSTRDTTRDTTTGGATARTVTFGDYEIGERLERRASADVYSATHLPTRGARLIYVLRPGAMENHPFVHQVVCEVDAARWLRHPIVATVDGYGDTPSRRMYVAVERPQGPSLEELLAVHGRMAPRRVVRFATRLVEAIEEAHALALIHGRLTPSAVFMAADDSGPGDPPMKLTGLGTGAVSLDGELLPMERRYVSPEQQLGREADVRSDVFGLASLLHHAITGSPPPEAGAAIPESIPAEQSSVVAVLARARSLDPADRPASVKAFWMDLLAALVEAAAAEPPKRESALDVALDRARAPMGILTPIGRPADAGVTPPARPAVPARPATPPPSLLAPLPLVEDRPAPPVRSGRAETLPVPVSIDAIVAELPRAAAAASATLTVPFIAKPVRRRTALLHLLWLAVPAAAAAAVWPSGSGGAYETQEGLAPILSDVGVRPHDPEEGLVAEAPVAMVAKPQPAPPPAPEPVRDSVRRRPAAPRVNAVAAPNVALPSVDIERPLVRPEDFSKGLTRPGGGR